MLNYELIIERGKRRLALQDVLLLEKHVRLLHPKTILEIGCMDGTSTVLFGSLAKELNAHVFSVEPVPKQRWYDNVKEFELDDTVTLKKGASPWIDPKEIGEIDFLFIDGDHRTRWALVDYHYWIPFVRKDGLIAFHDYNAMKGVGAWVRRAIDIILEDDKLEMVEKNETRDRGTVIFRKTW